MREDNIVGIDIGGTFTDFVSYDATTGQIENWKNLTTPENPIEGVLEGLSKIESMETVNKVRLGTTIATNALLTRKGAKVAYVTTCGFKDVPFIQRGDRRSHYDISWIKTKPFVSRADCFEVVERVSALGEEIIALDESGVREIAKQIREDGTIEAIAVCTLFSYVNPKHEDRIAEILAEELPTIPVSSSFNVLPKWKEYDRASTTIADAFLKPIVQESFARIKSCLDDLGVGDKVGVIKSNGGESSIWGAAATPVQMALSGPTGAVVATRTVAELTGIKNLVIFDMGGTSTDCATVVNGQENITTDFEIEWGIPIQVPMIDVHTIGAGGGSLAWIDKGGLLRMGPQSATSVPGPACYGRGGLEATVTDANVVLGRINPDYFLGGRMKLDAKAAHQAVARIADKLQMAVDEAAMAMLQIANNNMLGALRTVLLQRGLDPRDFTLLSSGGAGPVHVCDLLNISGIPQGLVPNYPGQFSAFGFIMTNARVDKHRTIQQVSTRFDAASVDQTMIGLVEAAVKELVDQGYEQNIQVQRSIEARYLGQNHGLELQVAMETITDESASQLWASFHEIHKARFGFAIPGETIELVTVKVVAVASAEKPNIPKLPAATTPAAWISSRKVRYEQGWIDTPIYDRTNLLCGHTIYGPAVIEESASVTILRPDQQIVVNEYGYMLVSAKVVGGE
ncbi:MULTISPECIES: hydantoinase/oxoprolinase family protein [Pseudomonas]|uniref:hydantoinase/oxoprolinase family protein n=1 Tax=Pseudomonas TaxID=286 RepID=UPI0002DC2C5B|nr:MULTISPECIES: hydantoinase/oxoprolinase family protein [Pseudomonas]AYN98110.1 hydantoinase/oxoprolinase family protein [Pseudomonas sp. LTGT-11-2Z]MDH0572774.1 hydantoinase/oxoprolinase family protein [Pseudomonas fulva]PIK78833.1 hydantoin utilization protein [Pseudomonas sp. 382]